MALIVLCIAAGAARADIYREPGMCYGPYPFGNPWQGGPFNSVAGQYCPNDPLVWPSVTVPAHVGPNGQLRPAQTLTLGPNALSSATSIVYYDPATSYHPTEDVVVASLRQSDALQTFGTAWSYHIRAGYPQNEADYRTALDYAQVFELVELAVNGSRDIGAHRYFTYAPGAPESSTAALTARCGGNRSCVDKLRILHNIELASVARGRTAGLGYGVNFGGLSYETFAAMFAVMTRPVVPAGDDQVCGRPIVCGQYRAEQQ